MIKTNTAIYGDGLIIYDRYIVISTYIKGNFLIDIVTTLSLIFAILFKFPYISLIFLARFSDVVKIYESLEETL